MKNTSISGAQANFSKADYLLNLSSYAQQALGEALERLDGARNRLKAAERDTIRAEENAP